MQDEEDEEEDEDEDVLAPRATAGAAPRPPPVNNQDGLASTLEDFEWPKDVPWIETLIVEVRAPEASRAPCAVHSATHKCS